MKCPFETPVRKLSDLSSAIVDKRGSFVALVEHLDYADYIIQAINSHEKLTEVIEEIEAVSCGETQIECDGVYDDSDGMLWIHKRIQALKEAEK